MKLEKDKKIIFQRFYFKCKKEYMMSYNKIKFAPLVFTLLFTSVIAMEMPMLGLPDDAEVPPSPKLGSQSIAQSEPDQSNTPQGIASKDTERHTGELRQEPKDLEDLSGGLSLLNVRDGDNQTRLTPSRRGHRRTPSRLPAELLMEKDRTPSNQDESPAS